MKIPSRRPIILIRLRSRSPISFLGLRLPLRLNDGTPTPTPKPWCKLWYQISIHTSIWRNWRGATFFCQIEHSKYCLLYGLNSNTMYSILLFWGLLIIIMIIFLETEIQFSQCLGLFINNKTVEIKRPCLFSAILLCYCRPSSLIGRNNRTKTKFLRLLFICGSSHNRHSKSSVSIGKGIRTQKRLPYRGIS